MSHILCHDLVCNCDRSLHPRGAPGVGCSCTRRAEHDRARAALYNELVTALMEYHRANRLHNNEDARLFALSEAVLAKAAVL